MYSKWIDCYHHRPLKNYELRSQHLAIEKKKRNLYKAQ